MNPELIKEFDHWTEENLAGSNLSLWCVCQVQ
jgi:hypothetical protein